MSRPQTEGMALVVQGERFGYNTPVARYPTMFHVLTAACERAAVPGVLVGGFAVNYYGAARQTADLDLVMPEAEFAQATPVFTEAGYRVVAHEHVFVRLRSEHPEWMDVDVLFVDRGTFDGLCQEGKEVTIAGQPFLVPALKHLIAMKLHAVKHNPQARRFRDLGDILELVKRHRIPVRSVSFRQLCLKYGSQALYDELLHGLQP